MDKLTALQTFANVAEAGGFSKAARKMGIATSSVTRTIDALEASLGVTLLARTTRQVTLTDAGTSYLDSVSKILSELVEADESVSGGDEPVGTLRVSVPITYGRLKLGPGFAPFLEAFPRLAVELVVSDAYIDLAAERIDVAVRIGLPGQEPGLIVRKLMDTPRVLVAAPGYLERAGTPADPSELATHTCVSYAYHTGRQVWRFRKDKRVQKIEAGGRFSANSLDLLRDVVLGSQGISLLPDWLVKDDISTGRLQRVLAGWEAMPQSGAAELYAAYLPSRRRSRKVQAFLQFLDQCISETARS